MAVERTKRAAELCPGSFAPGRRSPMPAAEYLRYAEHDGQVLAQLGQREHFVNADDLVFVGEAGGYLDGSALRRRYDRALARAGLRPLRFHDLRHTFGIRMIARADIRRVQEWMGHSDVQTTMKYPHYVPRHDEAALVADAFRSSGAQHEPTSMDRRPIA
jgi:integrase